MLGTAFDEPGKREGIVNMLYDGLQIAASEIPFKAILHTSTGLKEAIDIPSNESTFVLKKPVSHAILFPKCSLIVHHGGAGTLQLAIASGCPSIILPCVTWTDQPFWADLVSRRNLGLNGGLITKLDARKLSKLLVKALGHIDSFRESVNIVAKGMRQDDPVGFIHKACQGVC